ESVQVATIERGDGNRAGVERVRPRRKDLALAARGHGAEIRRELVDVVHDRGTGECRRSRDVEVEVQEARGQLPRPGDLPGAEAVAERESPGARGDLIRQGD